jgi:ribosomal protein S18 acetylase RimI-like enzyme
MRSATEVWTIRPASRNDRPKLADIYLTVRRTTFQWVDPSRFRREDFAAHSRGEQIMVCEDDNGDIAGFLALSVPDNFIHMLYVRAIYQSRGAGTALLEALPDWPMRRYRLKCLVHNKRALAFYHSRGFEIIGGGSSPEGSYQEMRLAYR